MDNWEGSQLNEAKEILAYELTALVHGEEEAEKAKTASHALFAGGGDDSNMPTTVIDKAKLVGGGIAILDLMTECGLIASKSDGRRLVQQGGVSINDEKITAIDYIVTSDALADGVKIRKGKKVYHKALID